MMSRLAKIYNLWRKRNRCKYCLKIFEDWVFDNYDKAIIVSWDSDIIPAIRRVSDLSKSENLK